MNLINKTVISPLSPQVPCHLKNDKNLAVYPNTRIDFIEIQIQLNITMSNAQFDFTNLEMLSSIPWNKFKQFCSLNGKQRNIKFITKQTHQKVIKTAIESKNNNQLNNSTFLTFENRSEDFPKWGFYQYKMFTYVVYLYRYVRQLNLNNLTLKDFQQIKLFFPYKPVNYLFYQYHNLIYIKKEKWSQQQDQNLVQLIKQLDSYQETPKISWKFVSYSLFESTEMTFFKNTKQCRQRWCNHLNPNLNRKEWSITQDLMLFKLIGEYGKKWSKLVKQLKSSRTEHMIKNRYNFYIRKWKKYQPYKKQDLHFKLILSYLNRVCEKKCKNNRTSKLAASKDCQYKNKQNSSKYQSTKIQRNNQNTPIEEEQLIQSKSEPEFDKILSTNPKKCQQSANIIGEDILYHGKSQPLLQLGKKVQSNVLERKQILMKQIIPEYMHEFQVQQRAQVYFDVELFYVLDDNFQKVVDDPFLSDLQQRWNLKWLENFQD